MKNFQEMKINKERTIRNDITMSLHIDVIPMRTMFEKPE